ncbi:uncharacterized protein LOC131015144 isoform X2 [Salvia miltiorrhiza]|uniref:uncharacterized protein LOC131015144 isoform X2 n=1 Tax=Salvia miltiorrhiza TaxID=226208 RepID=UPI0025AD4822|nr:uncharacterized protein LOC131015144 isoform X2 [Salvia miltiorrhiza]
MKTETMRGGSLVKQLSSSRTKDSSNPSLEGDGNSSSESLFGSSCDGFSDQKQEKFPPPPQPHKKQVRRRLHTSRPYQERLLNMAEARREIVTALKFHRAAMKQASERQQQMEISSETQLFESPSHQFSLEQEDKLKLRRNPRVHASNSLLPDKFPSGYLDNFSHSPYSWSVSPIASPPPPVHENFNFTLPSQTLGLNLNLQDFNNLDSTFHCSTNPSSIYSSSSPSTSSSPLSATTQEILCMGAPASVAEFGDSGLHPVMDDKEIAEIRSIGDQYQMEWDDTLNLVNSAWWFKFLKAMEITPENQSGEDFTNYPFDEVTEFPAWLNANDGCLQHVNDPCSDNYFEDPALPCMDIEEMEVMDGDWLA